MVTPEAGSRPPLSDASGSPTPSYTDEEQKTNVYSETVCLRVLRLLIKGLIVSMRP